MGYVRNHLATLVSGVWAVVLTGLYFPLVDFAPQLQFVFIMAVPIMWFMVFVIWIAQLAADRNHGADHSHDEKKNLESKIMVLLTTRTAFCSAKVTFT